jgi:hypothetical protein
VAGCPDRGVILFACEPILIVLSDARDEEGTCASAVTTRSNKGRRKPVRNDAAAYIFIDKPRHKSTLVRRPICRMKSSICLMRAWHQVALSTHKVQILRASQMVPNSARGRSLSVPVNSLNALTS